VSEREREGVRGREREREGEREGEGGREGERRDERLEMNLLKWMHIVFTYPSLHIINKNGE
jgi:hypothetical protein